MKASTAVAALALTANAVALPVANKAYQVLPPSEKAGHASILDNFSINNVKRSTKCLVLCAIFFTPTCLACDEVRQDFHAWTHPDEDHPSAYRKRSLDEPAVDDQPKASELCVKLSDLIPKPVLDKDPDVGEWRHCLDGQLRGPAPTAGAQPGKRSLDAHDVEEIVGEAFFSGLDYLDDKYHIEDYMEKHDVMGAINATLNSTEVQTGYHKMVDGALDILELVDDKVQKAPSDRS